MNLYEKIYNASVREALSSSSDADAFPIVTTDDRRWLRSRLLSGDIPFPLSDGLRGKLLNALEDFPCHVFDEAVEERMGAITTGDGLEHLDVARRAIRGKKGIHLSFVLNNSPGVIQEGEGVPWRLEYNASRREWYLLWRSRNAPPGSSTKTPLRNVRNVRPLPIEDYDEAIAEVKETSGRDAWTAIIEVRPEYRSEIIRILSAFSNFRRELDYDSEKKTYRLMVQYDEEGYLRSRIRFMGERVVVLSPPELRQAMLESAKGALSRYRP